MMGRFNDELKKRADDVFIGTYLRYPAAMVSGSGSVLTDADGKEYLDFLSIGLESGYVDAEQGQRFEKLGPERFQLGHCIGH